MEPDAMLRAIGEQARTYDATAWNCLLRHSIAKLNDWLGYEVETESLDNGCVGEGAGGGFCLNILDARPSKNDLFHWKGILGASIVDDRIRVGLTLFLYSGTQRLVTRDGKEFADFVFELNESGRSEWKLFGWFEDTYGEYSQF